MKTNEPIAWIYVDNKTVISDVDYNLFQATSSSNKTDWLPLYTHPAKENPDSYMFDALNNTLNLERNHNEKAYKELYDLCEKLAKENEALKAKTLTDEEKWRLWGECPHGLVYDRVMMFADLVLRKAQEK